MSVDKYQPHLLIVPEDDANRQLANGFLKHPSIKRRAVQPMQCSGGWLKVCGDLLTTYIPRLHVSPLGHVVMLIDFDNQVQSRLDYFDKNIPANLKDRIYILGTLSEPEPLRASRGISLEKIGEELANSCFDGNSEPWGHDLLKHNHAELQRLITNVKPFLFR